MKRCRSFKEDILSRLARNRSLGSESPGNATGAGSPTGWNNGDLLQGDVPSVEPRVSISHRLKEVGLTFSTVYVYRSEYFHATKYSVEKGIFYGMQK